jgi:pSer/pThr/pTyr-binding forkhead associated (FHA) protein
MEGTMVRKMTWIALLALLVSFVSPVTAAPADGPQAQATAIPSEEEGQREITLPGGRTLSLGQEVLLIAAGGGALALLLLIIVMRARRRARRKRDAEGPALDQIRYQRTVFCPGCGAAVSREAALCGVCGQSMAGVAPPPAYLETPRPAPQPPIPPTVDPDSTVDSGPSGVGVDRPGWRLVIVDGPDSGRLFAVEQQTSLGRTAGNDVRLGDPRVSSRHAMIQAVAGDIIISDRGSSNGTFVNGERIGQPTRLKDGDTIRLGRTTLSVSFRDADPEPTLMDAPPPPAGSVCPGCGASVADGTKFCMRCGAPQAAATQPASKAVCPSCGSSVEPGTKFCMTCGAAQAGGP